MISQLSSILQGFTFAFDHYIPPERHTIEQMEVETQANCTELDVEVERDEQVGLDAAQTIRYAYSSKA